MQEFTQEDIREVYEWVDTFNLSKIKKNIARDFSDGVLVFEILKPFYPDYVLLNSIISTNNRNTKKTNWEFIRSCLRRKSFNQSWIYIE